MIWKPRLERHLSTSVFTFRTRVRSGPKLWLTKSLKRSKKLLDRQKILVKASHSKLRALLEAVIWFRRACSWWASSRLRRSWLRALRPTSSINSWSASTSPSGTQILKSESRPKPFSRCFTQTMAKPYFKNWATRNLKLSRNWLKTANSSALQRTKATGSRMQLRLPHLLAGVRTQNKNRIIRGRLCSWTRTLRACLRSESWWWVTRSCSKSCACPTPKRG